MDTQLTQAVSSVPFTVINFFKIGTSKQHTAPSLINCFIIRTVWYDYYTVCQGLTKIVDALTLQCK